MAENRVTDQEFLEYAVKLLVDNPEDVKVERKIDEMGVLITLDVNAEDMGMIIGREGATAKALRTLLRVIGARNNARVTLKINEPEVLVVNKNDITGFGKNFAVSFFAFCHLLKG